MKTTIEANAKKLALLQKKKNSLQKQQESIAMEIGKLQAEIQKQFNGLGLDTSFF